MKIFLYCLLMLLSASVMAGGGMDELTYMDQDATGGGYVTRYLVTERYLRLDFGRDRDDYVLFDRREKKAYNISHEQREILVFEPGEITVKPPKEWEIREDFYDNRSAQKRLDLLVNGKVCTRFAAADKFLPEVAKALQEFHEVMAATHSGTYLSTPEDQRDECDLARLILAPERWFKYGMPLDELRSNGFSRRLLHYKADVAVRPSALQLPENYRLIRFNAIQGKVP